MLESNADDDILLFEFLNNREIAKRDRTRMSVGNIFVLQVSSKQCTHNASDAFVERDYRKGLVTRETIPLSTFFEHLHRAISLHPVTISHKTKSRGLISKRGLSNFVTSSWDIVDLVSSVVKCSRRCSSLFFFFFWFIMDRAEQWSRIVIIIVWYNRIYVFSGDYLFIIK